MLFRSDGAARRLRRHLDPRRKGQSVARAAGCEALRQAIGHDYTKYLLSALAFSSEQNVKDQLSSVVQRYGQFLKDENADTDDGFRQKLTALMASCTKNQLDNKSRIVETLTPGLPKESSSLPHALGVTSPVEILAALGKPDYEDYNADGRFNYNYHTTIGNDIYVFDRSNKLVDFVVYCDANKSKCPDGSIKK